MFANSVYLPFLYDVPIHQLTLHIHTEHEMELFERDPFKFIRLDLCVLARGRFHELGQ